MHEIIILRGNLVLKIFDVQSKKNGINLTGVILKKIIFGQMLTYSLYFNLAEVKITIKTELFELTFIVARLLGP